MTELTPRKPHQRRYTKAGTTKVIDVHADDHGRVEITEEALDSIIRQAGWTEQTTGPRLEKDI